MKVELCLTREDALATLALEMIVMEMSLEGLLVRRIEVTAGLEAVLVLGRQAPVLVPLHLIAELPMTRVAPNVLGSGEQVSIELHLSSKP